jgi:mannose-6-phosphate isomerase-like protein (cupin superfamily)
MVRVGDGAVVLRPGEARTIDIGSFDVAVLADGDATESTFSLIETREPEPALGPPLHIHRDCAESFVVLDGVYRMFIDDEQFDCEPGSFIYVPRNTRHTFQTVVAGCRKLNLYTPAAMIGYFDALAEGVRAGMPDVELDALAERFAMDVVGPIPERYLGGGAEGERG